MMQMMGFTSFASSKVEGLKQGKDHTDSSASAVNKGT